MAATRPNTASTLNPSTSVNVRGTAAWSPEDDQILIRARASNMNWQPIASTHFPSKTANACRKRHERLMEQHKKDDCDGVKFEAIAQAYLARREEMWKMIADMVNEKWQNVESKVSFSHTFNKFHNRFKDPSQKNHVIIFPQSEPNLTNTKT